MNTVSLVSVDMLNFVFKDNLKLKGYFQIRWKKIGKFELLLTRKKGFGQNLENISKVLEFGNSKEKIKILETLNNEGDPNMLEKIILKLDDDDLEVRGEAFSSLLLNKNKISNFLINNLNTANKNIRSFVSLVLANRNETSAIPEIIKLTKELAVTDTYLNFRRVVEKTKAVWDLMDKSQKIKFYDELIERYALLKRSGMSFERLREIKEKRSNP